jgi:hypothetical protein
MTTEIATNTDPNSKHISKQQSDVLNNDQTKIIQQPNVKFPLENSWSFWFYKNEKSKEWKDNLVFITTVDFVEDFWAFVFLALVFGWPSLMIFFRLLPCVNRVYNHLQPVSKLSAGCDYMFFKVIFEAFQFLP